MDDHNSAREPASSASEATPKSAATDRTTQERGFITAAKAISYLILFIAAALILFRGVVNTLWGSGSELGLLGAVAAGALGVLGLAYLALLMWRDLTKSNNKEG